jgi:PAS domain S-box-containing protein
MNDKILSLEAKIKRLESQLKDAVSEKNRYELAYQEEKEKFGQFVNLAPVGIAINRMDDGSFDYVNNEFSRFTGYEVDELNQMDYWQLTPKFYEEQEQEQLESLAETGRYGPYQKEYIHKIGHTYPVLLSGIKIAKSTGEEFIWSVVQDISRQKKVEQQAQAAQEEAEFSTFRMKLANDSAGIGVWEWDLLTNALIWDEWMYRLYGVSPEEFSGAYEAWENSVHPDDIEMARTKLNDAVEGTGIYTPEFRVVHPGGQVRTMKASAEVIRDENGKGLKVIGVNYDVTDKIKAINELKLAKREAEQANQSKSDFLANMSHEIRTPMNAILGGLQLLKNRELGQDNRVLVENASFSAKSLLTIINDILDYSKIQENKLDLELEPFSLIDVLDSVKFDVETQASDKGIELLEIIDDNFVDGWIGDIVRVKQILLNLVANAVKFTEQGTVKVGLSCKTYQGKESICINVIDSGIGMSEEAQRRIFERFVQADTSTTRKFGGTGLGMSITVNLIKMMGGNIDLRSVLNKGTTIRVLLPLEKSGKFIKEDSQKSVIAPQLRGKRILIAEDNEINQLVVESMLKATKADLTIVENGQLAVDAIKKEDFDLVLMDIQMPGMDGVEAQKRISTLKVNIPVIALTANVMVSEVNHYLEQGFVAHIGKPVDMNNLYGVLFQYLK